MLPLPDDESLLFARAVQALRVGVEALGPDWYCFVDVLNPTAERPYRHAWIRARLGRAGLQFLVTRRRCDLPSLHVVLDEIAAAGEAVASNAPQTREAHVALDAQWSAWTPERMKEILAS